MGTRHRMDMSGQGTALLLRRRRALLVVLRGMVSWRCPGMSVWWSRGVRWAWGSLGRGRGREDGGRRAGAGLGSKELGARLGGAVGSTWCVGACTHWTGPKSVGLRVTLARAALVCVGGQGWASECLNLREGQEVEPGSEDMIFQKFGDEGLKTMGLVGLASLPGTSPCLLCLPCVSWHFFLCR